MSGSEDEPRWIESGGGPLILLPECLSRSWRGTLGSPHNPISGDYARAARVRDYLGKIVVGNGTGLVLGGDPLPATIIRDDQGLVIARWVYAASEEAAMVALRRAEALTYVPEAVLFENTDEVVVLMDAALPGRDLRDSLQVKLPTGTYGVATAEYTPDTETSFVIHRLEKL